MCANILFLLASSECGRWCYVEIGGIAQGVDVRMKEELGELVGGYRKNTHSSYSFSIFTTDDKICFEEDYDYYARGDDEGGEYVYGLSFPMADLDRFLLLLMKKCNCEQPVPQDGKSKLLQDLLTQLVSQGAFKSCESAAIKENLLIVHRWLEDAGIPHKPPYLAY